MYNDSNEMPCPCHYNENNIYIFAIYIRNKTTSGRKQKVVFKAIKGIYGKKAKVFHAIKSVWFCGLKAMHLIKDPISNAAYR